MQGFHLDFLSLCIHNLLRFLVKEDTAHENLQ